MTDALRKLLFKVKFDKEPGCEYDYEQTFKSDFNLEVTHALIPIIGEACVMGSQFGSEGLAGLHPTVRFLLEKNIYDKLKHHFAYKKYPNKTVVPADEKKAKGTKSRRYRRRAYKLEARKVALRDGERDERLDNFLLENSLSLADAEVFLHTRYMSAEETDEDTEGEGDNQTVLNVYQPIYSSELLDRLVDL